MPKRRLNINELADWQPSEGHGGLPKCETSGKEMHPTERDALAAAGWRESKSGAAIDVYYCLWCGAWHLTSSKN